MLTRVFAKREYLSPRGGKLWGLNYNAGATLTVFSICRGRPREKGGGLGSVRINPAGEVTRACWRV